MGEGKDTCCAFLPGFEFTFGKHIEWETARGYISAEINAQYEKADSNISDDVAGGMAFDE